MTHVNRLRILLSDDEKEYILDNAGKISKKEMANYIGCTVSAIVYQLRKKGFNPSESHKWSKEDFNTLQTLWNSHTPISKIASHFNVNVPVIYVYADKLRKKGVYLESRQHHYYK